MLERGGSVRDRLAGRCVLARADADPAVRAANEVAVPVGVVVGPQPHRPVLIREPHPRLVPAAGPPAARQQDELFRLPKGAVDRVYLKVILSVVLSVTCCLSSGLFLAFVEAGWLTRCQPTIFV